MSLNNLKTRIAYQGGGRQVDRMIDDKKRSLNKALLYSYQSATAVLEDGREFRCLINPNKISMEADDKMLSIPFKDICLNKEPLKGEKTLDGKEEIGIRCGSVIEWKENGTHWIVYSQCLQEIAYFRGLMRQCENEYLEIGGKRFWYYLKGPDEKGIDWQKTKHLIFNDLNYTIEIYISNTTETNEFFQRFKKLKIKGKPFKVQAVDSLSTDGILTVYLKEDYTNEWAPEEEAKPTPPEATLPLDAIRIDGPLEVYPYDIIEYQILNIKGGTWCVSNNRARILNQSESSVKIEITTGKSGSFSLIYKNDDKVDIKQNIEILSL